MNNYAVRCEHECLHKVMLFLKDLNPDYQFLYNTEDTGNNRHHHFFFQCKLKLQTIRVRRMKFEELNAYPGNRWLSFSNLRTSVEEYLRYICKGFNVKKPYDTFIKDGKYIGDPPTVYGVVDYINLHQEFWKNYLKIRENSTYKKKESKSVTTEWLNHIRPILNGLEFSNSTSFSQLCYYREMVKIIWKEIFVFFSLNDDRKADRTVYRQFMHAALVRYDKSTIYKNIIGNELYDEFLAPVEYGLGHKMC